MFFQKRQDQKKDRLALFALPLTCPKSATLSVGTDFPLDLSNAYFTFTDFPTREFRPPLRTDTVFSRSKASMKM